ncbi:CU044_5270 family protein [Streptosporangium canum]|uniref:CU044_5270 family protein n=1 Tax=Streptosporangium canum TaxID=324952 RepID=UPI00379D52A2
MDDLDTLATLLTKPEPSTEAITRSRNRLQDRMRGRARRRIGWLMPGVGLATAAAAVVAVIATGVTTSAGAPVSGREVLLMAAAGAERTPQGSGTYWYVRSEWSDPEIPAMESWTRRDGRRWTKGEPGDPPGVAVPTTLPLSLKGAKVSFEDLEGLPTDPEALKARITERKGRADDMSRSEQRGDPLFPLLSLISELPTPSEVRSAAFRALATTPGVESGGAVEGGQELLIPNPEGGQEIKLVVDPETARVTRTNYLLSGDGNVAGTDEFISVTTNWTDQPPR